MTYRESSGMLSERLKFREGRARAHIKPTNAPRRIAPRRISARGLSRLRHFGRDEGGSLVVFALFMFVLMIMITGMAIDVMRHETTRTKLQNTLDRAILAAADLDQTLDPETVVRDYFEKAGMTDYLVSVDVDQGANYRIVGAETQATVNTLFMRLMNINQLNAPAAGQAEERVSDVEISLVLDISGSMGRNNKIVNLRDAAKDFVDTVLRDETENMISLSLIPYTAQVNAGPEIFNQIQRTSTPNHGFSHCIDFTPSDFTMTGIDPNTDYEQMQHFEWSSRYYHPTGGNSWPKIGNPGCPQQDYERIVPLSQDSTELKDTIDDYRARANTAIHIGMKWGTVLLDPSTNGIVQNLVNSNTVDAVFDNRPESYSATDTLKVVVLMTDGENVATYRIRSRYYNSASEYVQWDRYPLWWWLYRNVSRNRRWRYYERRYSSSDADNMLDNICDAAKSSGIVVFSIGFEVSNHGANVMQSCASSPAHFFRVEGTEISEAFKTIASQINQLRLTQ